MKSSLKAIVGALCLVVASAAAGPQPSFPADPATAGPNRAILVLIPADPGEPFDYDERITTRFAAIPGVAAGLVSATQGSYSRDQALLDMSQGTRVSRSTYDPTEVPSVNLIPSATGARLDGWKAILDRAETAPQTIEPGLLASSVPGGAAIVLPYGEAPDAAIPATDRRGRITRFLQGPSDSITETARRALARHDFVVVVTSPGGPGLGQFTRLAAERKPGDLVIGMQAPPEGAILPLLGIGIAGLPTDGGELTSRTTNLPGMVAGIDIAPTVLVHLGLPIPSAMTGQPMSSEGETGGTTLNSFRERLSEVAPRRIPVLISLVVGWLILVLAAGVVMGRERARLPVLRIGGLALLWLPFAILIPAALGNLPRSVEPPLIGFLCILLGFLSDRFLPWPRATILPAAFGIGAISIDLALGSDLIIRSVWGPNPGYGARFYGIGNELQSGLPVLLLAGVAGLMGSRKKSRQMALAVLAAGLILGAIVGSGRLGASVGASITIAVTYAVTAVMVLPGRLTGRRIALLVVSPLIGLALLAGLDLLTSNGEGHYIRNVIQGESLSSFADTVERRTTLAWQQFGRESMPLITLIASLTALWAIRNRAIYQPFHGPIWSAVLIGGLAGGVIGSFTEDSGPMLLLGAVFMLIGVSAYLIGRPDGAREAEPTDPDSVTG